MFAQQLTKMDCELFKRLIPHQCLGHVWSRRDKTARDKDAATVVATVDQVLYTRAAEIFGGLCGQTPTLSLTQTMTAYQFLGPYDIVLSRPESFEVGHFKANIEI